MVRGDEWPRFLGNVVALSYSGGGAATVDLFSPWGDGAPPARVHRPPAPPPRGPARPSARLRPSSSFPEGAGDLPDAPAAAAAAPAARAAPRARPGLSASAPRLLEGAPPRPAAEIPSIHGARPRGPCADRALELRAGRRPAAARGGCASGSESYAGDDSALIGSAGSSSDELALEDNNARYERKEEAAESDGDIDANGAASNATDESSLLEEAMRGSALRVESCDNAGSARASFRTVPSSARAANQAQETSFARLNELWNPGTSPRTSPPDSPRSSLCSVSVDQKSSPSYKTLMEVRETCVNDYVDAPGLWGKECSIPSGDDNTTVSIVTEPSSDEYRTLQTRNVENEKINYDKSVSNKANESIYYKENQEMHKVCRDKPFVRSQSCFSALNQLNSVSFDEDALIQEFELQSLEDQISARECVGNEMMVVGGQKLQLVNSLTLGDEDTVEQDEIFKLSNVDFLSLHVTCSKTSPNINSLSEEVLFREAISYSNGLQYSETPSTIKSERSIPENLKYEFELLSVDSERNESDFFRNKSTEDQSNGRPDAPSDLSQMLNDSDLVAHECKEEQHEMKYSSAQVTPSPLISPQERQSIGSSNSGRDKTPSSESNVLTNGMTYMELDMSSGGFLHTETDASRSQLTCTKTNISGKVLKVDDQDYSSSSLPYTEADVSSNDFPRTEQEIESSMIYTDADASSNRLAYNEPDDTSSGWPPLDIDTNSTSKLHNEIDTSSYGISSNEFDASSSVFDSSSSGLPYIECESTNRLSYKALQSCSSGHDVDSVSAGSSGVEGEEEPVPELFARSITGTNEAPCKDQLKCFPF